MRVFLTSAVVLLSGFAFAQTEQYTLKQEEIKEVVVIAKKPTVESKADRTVYNVANSSVVAGNSTWEVLRMAPLVSIDNNDAIKAEGESVTVYINDRKTVFTGSELKDYLKTIPAENLSKIEVITSPSSRYESAGAVINIVLKKRDDEGMKGSVSLTNTQNTKNSQYANFNVNYHKRKFTQTFTGSYNNNIYVQRYNNINTIDATNSVNEINTESISLYQSPSFSSTSEWEFNDKNSMGVIVEYSQSHQDSDSKSNGSQYLNQVLQDQYLQNQNIAGFYRNLGTNIFYKYYDKEKNKILDLSVGSNYSGQSSTNIFIKDGINLINSEGSKIFSDTQNRNYYVKVDYTTSIGESGGNLEFGGKANFNNNVVPNHYFTLENSTWLNDLSKSNVFRYSDNLNSAYLNFSKTFFKKLETRIGLRYEYMSFKLFQEVGDIRKKSNYGSFLPNLLVKYSISENYDLTANYNHNIWRPWFTEFNPFLMPTDEGFYYRGNMDLLPNPNNRFGLKLGFKKKYFLSASYWYSDQDYWQIYKVEDGKTISMPENFSGLVQKFSLNFNTNQTFFSNKLNVNLNAGINYTDNSDFNGKNNLNAKNYFTNFGGSSNISYTNLLDKNINLNAWVGVYTQNYGNNYGNNVNVFHTISVTKIFPKTNMEASMQLNNIFMRPNFDITTYSPLGTFRTNSRSDWHGISLTFIKRFGNQKVKENTKTDLEKNEGGGK